VTVNLWRESILRRLTDLIHANQDHCLRLVHAEQARGKGIFSVRLPCSQFGVCVWSPSMYIGLQAGR
jgi:hypothetical protein